MPVIAAARSLPPIAVHWVKNNILAAIVSGVVTFSIYGIRSATGTADADPGLVTMLILHVVAIGLWAFVGAATGVLTGAVLQRILPLLPTRTWIALQVLLAVISGLGGEMLSRMAPLDPSRTHDVSVLATLLVGLILGALLGAAIGGLETLVLRKAAFGTGAWITCSAVAYGFAMLLIAGSESLWTIGGELAGQVATQVVTLLAAVIASLIMLPALRRLKTPLSAAPQNFT